MTIPPGIRVDASGDRAPSPALFLVLVGFVLVAAGTLAACSFGGILLGIGLALAGHHD